MSLFLRNEGEGIGLRTPPVSWLGGLKRAAFPSGWPETDPAGQWLARYGRRLTVARRRRLHTVFPNAEFAVNVERDAERRMRCRAMSRGVCRYRLRAVRSA